VKEYSVDLKNLLGRVVPKDRILYKPEDLICYSYDACTVVDRKLPDIIVVPQKVEEIVETIKLASKHNIPVIPRGLGSGCTGGAIPVYGGIILSLEKYNKILAINQEEMTAVVESGVVTEDIKEEVNKYGLFYPPDPSSSKFSTIGGNVAESAGGLRGLKYGTTKEYVIGLEFIDGKGDVYRTGYLNSAENMYPDLTNILIRSEGTLGIITKIALRLLKLRENITTFFVCVKDLSNAAQIIGELRRLETLPSVLEIIDKTTIDAILTYKKFPVPAESRAFLLIEYDMRIDEKNLKKIFSANEALMVKKADNESEREYLWSIRKAISPSLVTIAPDKFNEDIVVPVSRLKEMLEFLEFLSNKYKLKILSYGHAGDGNLHVNIMINKKNKEDLEKVEKALDEIFDRTIELGGSLSGEHGIGLAKSPFLIKEFTFKELSISKKLKEYFDPYGIINPGKVLPEKLN